ncbi:MAG: hypothetical protein IPI60_15415 [Saprospiraceae bacterium]|nr:hypothetical protein [Saprospiraceae bacterium]
MSSEYEFEFDLHDIPAQDHRIRRFIENAEEAEPLDALAFADKNGMKSIRSDPESDH